jgi:transcriptional regulator with XRE-family HTH domain
MTAIEKVRRGLALLCRARGWSLRQLARESHVSVSTISRILNGQIVSPDWSDCETLAVAMGSTLTEVITLPEAALPQVSIDWKKTRPKLMKTA